MRGPAFLLALTLAVPAHADAFRCEVADFLSTDGTNTAFHAQNLDKIFHLDWQGDAVTVTVTSPHFEDSVEHFRVLARDFVNAFAFPEDRMDFRMVLPENPAAQTGADGTFNASYALQGTFFANTWFLSCAAA